MRLNRHLAAAGFGSRRAVEELIVAGRVRINGRVVTELATTVEPGDSVMVGSRAARAPELIHLLFHKPKHVLCSTQDETGEERATVFSLLPRDMGFPRLFTVGRLDYDSEGLILLTNDGALAQKLAHPSHGVEKEYHATLDRPLEAADAAQLMRGVFIRLENPALHGGAKGDEETEAPQDEDFAPPPRRPAGSREDETAERVRAKAQSVRPLPGTGVSIVLTQGLKRQIRLMLHAVGYKVRRLVRTRIGGLSDPRLRPGHFRRLTPREVKLLLARPKPQRAEDRGSRMEDRAPGVAGKPRSAGQPKTEGQGAWGSRGPRTAQPRDRAKRPGRVSHDPRSLIRDPRSAPRSGRRANG